MQKRQSIQSRMGLGLLLVAALVLVMLPARAQGAVNCAAVSSASTTDTDGDGFTDYEECNGITLAAGTVNAVTFPRCDGILARANCLDPDTKDLFVILVYPSTGSIINQLGITNPLAYISKPQAQGGLGIATHVITSLQADNKCVTKNANGTCHQKAVTFVESLTLTGNILGFSDQGGINSSAGATATVYTKQIVQFVESVYTGAGVAIPATVVTDVKIPYILHTIAHEFGHTLSLGPTYNDRYGGYHYKTGDIVIMEQAVYYTVKGSTVTWSISTGWAIPADPAAEKLF